MWNDDFIDIKRLDFFSTSKGGGQGKTKIKEKIPRSLPLRKRTGIVKRVINIGVRGVLILLSWKDPSHVLVCYYQGSESLYSILRVSFNYCSELMWNDNFNDSKRVDKCYNSVVIKEIGLYRLVVGVPGGAKNSKRCDLTEWKPYMRGWRVFAPPLCLAWLRYRDTSLTLALHSEWFYEYHWSAITNTFDNV